MCILICKHLVCSSAYLRCLQLLLACWLANVTWLMISSLHIMHHAISLHTGIVMQVCTAQLGYTASSSRLCNTFACTSTADCSNNGVCDAATSACQCQSGFTGPNCGISTGLCNSTASASNSTAAAAGNSSQICCSTGVVDSAGGCCDSGKICTALLTHSYNICNQSMVKYMNLSTSEAKRQHGLSLLRAGML